MKKRVVKTQVQPVVKRFRHAIEWALGAYEDFKIRKEGDGPFWWRKELQKRAGLKWEGEKFIGV